MAAPDEQIEALEQAVTDGIKSVTTSNGTVETVPLKDRLEAIKFLEARRPGRKVVRLFRVIPPGAV
ncbi:MAG: hypothetical protein U0840_25625 [Gemmataceae bacterium]